MAATCTFICKFDTIKGNIIEWLYPQECYLNGIEYSSLPSGGHRIRKDVILFTRNGLCGFAVFENREVDTSESRGAQMVSVGILQTSWNSIGFFEHSLYDSLRLIQAGEVEKAQILLISCVNHEESTPSVPTSPRMSVRTILPRNSGMKHFISKYGVNVFVIWKHAILRKRILFFNHPPVGYLCADVHWSHFISNIPDREHPKPFLRYHVTLADYEELEYTNSWIACTTEGIFERKKDLYSIFVTETKIIHGDFPLDSNSIYDINSSDYSKYNEIVKMKEDIAETYFPRLSHRLYVTLKELEQNNEKINPAQHLKQLNLHPRHDREFIKEFCRVYGIKLQWNTSNFMSGIKRSISEEKTDVVDMSAC